MPWVDFTNTAGRPSDGRGGLESTAAATYTTNDTLFTGAGPNGATVTGASVAAMTGLAVGGVIVTTGSGGQFWGVVQSFDAAPTPDIITVDKWRKWGFPASSGLPAANDDLKFFPAFFGVNQERVVIDAIEVRKATAADTITISDLYGSTTMKLLTVGATAGPFIMPEGWEIYGPFTVVTSAATTACTAYFRFLSAK